jgi:ubiquinone/menaquinone biosynthesis C-methylase UbiE
MKELYEDRYYMDGFPEMEQLHVEWYRQFQFQGTEDNPRPLGIMTLISRLFDLENSSKKVTVIGTGPSPISLKNLLKYGYDAVGVEPVQGSVESAREFLNDVTRVKRGAAEDIPLPDGSQKVILLEGVLEHVDSPEKSIEECFRVLEPGGVLFVDTTNRHRFSVKGYNGEFNIPFYNWLPAILKESIVFQHLHYNPTLANYSPRPAVHWFTYTELCRLGRAAGFAQFYSKLDLARAEDDVIKKRMVSRVMYKFARHNPILRSLALLQFGNAVFMLKRPE